MNRFTSVNRTLPLAVVFAGLFIVSNLAIAQQAKEEIIVRASEGRAVDVTPVGSPVMIEEIIINRPVRLTDLDLSTSADIEKLDMRIEEVAKESCQKLSDMSPLDRSNPMQIGKCVKRAIASAEQQRETAISAGP